MSYKRNGFTTLELAIVIIVFGIVTTVVMGAFGYYSRQRLDTATNEALETSLAALDEFRGTYGAYPCPADPSLGPGDPNYGREVRNPAAPATTPPCTVNWPTPTCECGNAVRVPGKDTSLDAGSPGTPERDWVAIGSVPIATLKDPDNNPLTADGIYFTDLPDQLTVDGYGGKLRYAVTESLTLPIDYYPLNGAIDIKDEFGNSTVDPGKWAHLGLISHGPNGRGAYTLAGNLVSSCPPSTSMPPAPPPEVANNLNETANCNPGNTFLDGLWNDKDHSYNDDSTKFLFIENSDLWTFGVDISQITNTNSGFVGIGTNTPSQQLEVEGDITAIQGDARVFCGPNGIDDGWGASGVDDCMPPETIGGNGTNNAAIQCPPGMVMTAIENNSVLDPSGATHCVSPFSMITNQTCGTNSSGVPLHIKGVRGVAPYLICCDPTITNSSDPNSCDYVPPTPPP